MSGTLLNFIYFFLVLAAILLITGIVVLLTNVADGEHANPHLARNGQRCMAAGSFCLLVPYLIAMGDYFMGVLDGLRQLILIIF